VAELVASCILPFNTLGLLRKHFEPAGAKGFVSSYSLHMNEQGGLDVALYYNLEMLLSFMQLNTYS